MRYLKSSISILTLAMFAVAYVPSSAAGAEFEAEKSTESFTVSGIEGEEGQTFTFANGNSVSCAKVKTESGSASFPAKSFKATLNFEGCTATIESTKTEIKVSCEPSTFEVGEGEVSEEGEVAGSITFGACTFTTSRCPLMKECTIKTPSQKYTGVTYIDEAEAVVVKFALKEGEYEATCPSAKGKGATYTGVVAIAGAALLQVGPQHKFIKTGGAYPVEEESGAATQVFTFRNNSGEETEDVDCPETKYKSKLPGASPFLIMTARFSIAKKCVIHGSTTEVAVTPSAKCVFSLTSLDHDLIWTAIYSITTTQLKTPCEIKFKNEKTGCERKIESIQRSAPIVVSNLESNELEVIPIMTKLKDTVLNNKCTEATGNYAKNETDITFKLNRIKAEF